MRDNSIVWVTPGASGNLPGEYFVLETFTALNGIITQKATIYIYQGLPIIKERIYCNGTWSDWDGYTTKFDFVNVKKVSFTSDVNTGDIGLTYALSDNDWVLVTFEMSTNKITLSVTHNAGNTWENIFVK